MRWFCVVLALACCTCDKSSDDSEETTTDEPRRKRRKKRRAQAKASASATASASTKTAIIVPTAVPTGSADPLKAPPDVALPPLTAKREKSGLASVVIKPGTGTDHPSVNDTVEVHYTGWMADGTMFDSSYKRKRPATFGVTKVIKGWTEGLQLMVAGEIRRLWIPADMAYGDKPRRPGGPYGQLTFDVELISIRKAPSVPKDLKTPPPTAKRTASGLVYRYLKRGTGKVFPKATSKVEVHYSGWTQDGKMFDSSVTRKRPAKFSLSGVIKGWTEMLQLMRVGDIVRVWIPANLAYGTSTTGGRPSGLLVFDIELLSIPSP